MFFDECIEMLRVFKPQTIAYFGDAPIAVSEQPNGFLQNSVVDELRSRLTNMQPEAMVQMIDMHAELICKIGRAF